MARFYFNLVSKHAHIPDESGKELYTLNDACVYARKLIDKILFRVGHAGAEAWTVKADMSSGTRERVVYFIPTTIESGPTKCST